MSSQDLYQIQVVSKRVTAMFYLKLYLIYLIKIFELVEKTSGFLFLKV